MRRKKQQSEAPTPPSNEPVFIETDIPQVPGESVPEETTGTKMSRAQKQKRHARKTLTTLKNIYEEEGEVPDLTRLERRRRNPRVILIGLIIFFAVLALAAWAGFFIFKPYGRFEGKGAELAIRGPDEPKAGDPVRYEFTYRNTERVALAALELRLVIPKEFNILEATPLPTDEPATWTLGGLPRGGSGAITIRGYFLGPGEGTSAFQSIATYRPANFNADFQTIVTKQIALHGTVLDATIAGPHEVAPGETGEYIYTLKNTGGEPLSDLEMVLEAPDTFLFDEAEPVSVDERGGRWTVATLEPGTETTVKVRGSFAATARGMLEVGMSVGVRAGDERLVHRRDTITTDVLASDLSLDLVVNGSHAEVGAGFGDVLHATLAYKNLGELTFGDVRLGVTITADPNGLVDWSNVETSAPGRISGGTFTWTSRELTALGSLGAGAEGTIDLTIPLVGDPPETGGPDELRLSGTALISTVGGRVVGRQVETTPILVRLNSDLNFTAEARYFDADDAPLGSGPLPPKIGETTNLRVLWHIENSRHALEGIRVRTTLPARVTWTGRHNTELGVISWDAGSRTVTLTIDRLGTETDAVTADFEVAITPEAADVGRFMTLTNDTTLSARDTVTGTVLAREAEPLTSEMPTDSEVGRRGAVVD
ncbi:hypothetical protein HY478_00110 [Candidatus Uhrbacteria bacterium]|nr:hypothetical protein [Candidatus Uhrbacteria bacterium]